MYFLLTSYTLIMFLKVLSHLILKIESFVREIFQKGVWKYFKIFMKFFKYFKVKYFIVHSYYSIVSVSAVVLIWYRLLNAADKGWTDYCKKQREKNTINIQWNSNMKSDSGREHERRRIGLVVMGLVIEWWMIPRRWRRLCKKGVGWQIMVPVESPCPRGSSKTNLQVLVLVFCSRTSSPCLCSRVLSSCPWQKHWFRFRFNREVFSDKNSHFKSEVKQTVFVF